MFVHLVARAEVGRRPFAKADGAWRAWAALRRTWPRAVAACLMPNHLHLITPANDASAERARLCHVLAGLSRRWQSPRAWEPVPNPELIRDCHHLNRQVRYVILNPCRATLTDDPICHLWSTHRGVIGAEVNPWVDADWLAKALGRRAPDFASRFHAYISGDPSANPAGTSFPVAAPRRVVPAIPLALIVRAGERATPWSKKIERARLTVKLARHQGWRATGLLATALGISERSVRRFAAEPVDPRWMAAATLCLGDARLLQPATSAWPKSGQDWGLG